MSPTSSELDCAPDQTQANGLRLQLGGDLIGPNRPVAPSDRAAEAVMDLFAVADIGFANHEGSTFDLSSFEGVRAAENGGGYPLAAPDATQYLRTRGINLVSKANNHATDWGLEGLAASVSTLRECGIASAGSGPNLAAAQRPAYVETAHGRVALVALASSFLRMSRAGSPGGVYEGRPGIFPYRVEPVNIVPDSTFDALLEVVRAQSGPRGWLDSRSWANGDELVVGQERFRRGDENRIEYVVNVRDHADLLRAVRFAHQTADAVIVAVHAHESRTGSDARRQPPQFLIDMHRAAIDAGADVCVTTGPHIVRGIEIYRQRPIFYGMGSLFLEMESGYGLDPDTVRASDPDASERTPGEATHGAYALPDEWYDSMTATVEFTPRGPSHVTVQPLRLQRRDGFRVMGSPTLARRGDAERILNRLAEDSIELGTTLVIHDDTASLQLE